MSNCLRLNSENKELMDYALRYTATTFSNSEDCLPFIGTILYLKKIGANLIVRCPDENVAELILEFDKLLSYDPLRDVINDIWKNVTNFVRATDVKELLWMIGCGDFDRTEYLHWYDYAIENTSQYKNHLYQSIVPRGLTVLAKAFIGENAKNTLIPFGGIMNFATKLDTYDRIEAYEFYRKTWQIGMLRVGLAGIASKVQFTSQNIDYWPNGKYDAIISMPPFGLRMGMQTPPLFFNAGPTEDSELIAPFRFIDNTTDDGVCVAFARTSILYGESSKKRFRIWAVEHKLLDTVILLPGNMLNGTNIALACIILRKKPYRSEAVRMIDATGFYTNYKNRNLLEVGDLMEAYRADVENISRTVTYKEIEEHDFSWNIKEYFQKEEICPEGFSLSVLEDLISLPRLETCKDGEKGYIVNVSDLSDDWSHPYIHIENLSEEYVHRAYSRLDRDAILVSSVRALKPSIIKASEECPVWINPNILVIIPSEVVDAEYLCMKLSEIKIHTIGEGVPFIPKTFLLRQKIVYPALSIQKSLYADGVRTLAMAKINELGLQGMVDQMKADYINEVRARKHDMKTPMTQLRNTLTLIKELVNELPEEYAYRLDRYVNRQQKAMDIFSDIVTHIADEDKFATPEVFDIETELKSLETVADNYRIKYYRDTAALEEAEIDIPYLKIGRLDFRRLSQNIVSNAIKRGFVKDNAEYTLNITLSVEKGFYVIDFCNNGEPLPDGMDKVRYGTKGTKGVDSEGSGIGGYIVKSITQHYGGDFEIFSSKFGNMYFTNVIVKFPIYRREDE